MTKNHMTNWRFGRTAAICLVGAAMATTVAAKEFGVWSAPVNAETLAGSSSELNTASNDGCPILSPYDDALYIASNRPGGQGGLDIWRAERSGDGWGAPVNLGPEINSAADDFCPSPARGNRLFFVSKRAEANGDIYVAKLGPRGWFGVTQLGSNVNSSAQEWSPSYFETESGSEVLYFSSTRNGNQDIFYSVNFGPAQLAAGGVNSANNDARPNVRHDGLEIVWDSDRFGTLGATDIWVSTRDSIDDPWGPAVHYDAPINSAAGESRASLSWDGTRLVFGSSRPGGEGAADVYTATRAKLTGD